MRCVQIIKGAMMEQKIQTIAAIVQTLRGLFEEKDRLVGVKDWDSFIGCLIALENLANELQNNEG